VKNTSEASKDVVNNDVLIIDKPVSDKKALEKESGKSSKRTTRASGSGADASLVPQKKAFVAKNRRKLKLSAVDQEELEKDDAIRIVEELKEKEAAEEARLVESWESFETVVPNPVLDGPLPKDVLMDKLANQGIYKRLNFDEIPNYVINGPKHAKLNHYTVPVKNSFSTILSKLNTNCIEEVAASASDETPVVSFAPSPESMRRFSEHIKLLIAETGGESSVQQKNIEQEVPEAHAETAASDELPQNISLEDSSILHPPSPTPIDSENTLSDPSPKNETVVEPLTEVDQHASYDVVESLIPEQEKAKLQKLAQDLENPSPQKTLVLTPDQNTFIKSFEQAFSTHNDLPLNITSSTLGIASSSTPTAHTPITPNDVERVLLSINDKIKEFHQKLPSLSVAPSIIATECQDLSKMCQQMFMDYSFQYEKDYVINISRQKFIQDKVDAARVEAQRLYDEKMKVVQTEAEDQLSTLFAQEMKKMLQVESETAESIKKSGSEVLFKKLEQISANVLKQLQEEMLNPSVHPQT
jgi:hypothetical protein